jgi:hypothetical protein
MGRPHKGYRLADGSEVTGVTTVLNRFKNSGPLLHWAFAQGKLAEQGHIKHLYDKRDHAADIGTAAHEMTECFLRDEDPYAHCRTLLNSDADIAKAAQAYEMFLEWWEQTSLKVYKYEIPLVSERYRFGGTPDWILETPRGLAIGDIKTSKGIYVDYLIQVAAYKALWEENYPDEPIVGGFHICRFSKDFPDFDHKFCAELNDAWNQFILFLRAYDNDKLLKKRAA